MLVDNPESKLMELNDKFLKHKEYLSNRDIMKATDKTMGNVEGKLFGGFYICNNCGKSVNNGEQCKCKTMRNMGVRNNA